VHFSVAIPGQATSISQSKLLRIVVAELLEADAFLSPNQQQQNNEGRFFQGWGVMKIKYFVTILYYFLSTLYFFTKVLFTCTLLLFPSTFLLRNEVLK